MDVREQLYTKLIHCGNYNINNPEDAAEKNVFFMPMGLLPLANALHENGFDTEIIHMDLEKGKKITEILDFSQLDAVGFDCHWVNQSLVVLETAKLLKEIKPELFVFLGGFTASLFAEELLAGYLQIDAIIRGDGELPLIELAKTLRDMKKSTLEGHRKQEEKYSQIPNLVWRDSSGRVRSNRFSYTGSKENMEQLDFAALDLLRNWETYQTSSRFWTRFAPIDSSPLFFLEVGRGCPYTCSFCGGNCLAQKRMNQRKGTVIRSVDSVISTIKKASSLGYQTFYSSLEFEGSQDWYIQLFQRVKEEGLAINYVYGSWRLPSKDLIDTLSDCCNQVLFEISPETADEGLRWKNKDHRLFYTNQQLEECLDYIHSKPNMKVQLYFGYFLPFDTESTVMKTLEYILKISMKYPELLEAEYFNFSTDPGSLLFFYPEKYDIDIKVRNFQDYLRMIRDLYLVRKIHSPDLRVFKPRGLSSDLVEQLECQIRLFNGLFSIYRKSVSWILQKTQNPQMIMALVRENTLLTQYQTGLGTESFKQALQKVFEKLRLVELDLLRLIHIECERQQQKQEWKPKATPQIWLDFEVDTQGSDEFNELMGFINRSNDLEKPKDDLEIEFEI